MAEEKNVIGADEIKDMAQFAAALNSQFKKYNDLLSGTATKDEIKLKHAELIVENKKILENVKAEGDAIEDMKKKMADFTETIKAQGATIEKMKTAFIPGEDQKTPFHVKLKEVTSSDMFKKFANGDVDKMRYEMQFKDVAFTGTYGSSAARQAYMPFNVPQGPDLESFDVRVVVPTGTTDSTSLQYPTERAASLTDATATKAENTALAESTLGFTMGTATAQKLGAFIEVSRAALRNTAWLESYINGRLLAMWIKALNTQVIAGDGTGTNLSGLVTNQNAFTGIDDSFIDAIDSPNNFSVLNCAKGAMEENYFLTANAYFINPVDKVLMSETKSTIGEFVDTASFLSRDSMGYTGAFGMRSVSSADITAGNYLVAAVAPENMQLLFNGPIEILMSDSHASNFIADLVTIKIQGFAMLPIYKAGSLVGGTFATDIGNLESGA